MKNIILWILGIVLISLFFVNIGSFEETILDEQQIQQLKEDYQLNFDENWKITKYKQNNLFSDNKVIIDAKNFQVNTLFPSCTKYVTMRITKDKTEADWMDASESIMIEEELDNDELNGKVEVIYSNRYKIDDDNYIPIYRFSFEFNEFNYIIEFNNGSGDHTFYNTNDKEIKSDELQIYINYISNVLNID